jgi:hypothetical protein
MFTVHNIYLRARVSSRGANRATATLPNPNEPAPRALIIPPMASTVPPATKALDALSAIGESM